MVKLTFVARGNQRMGCAGEAGLAIGDQIRQLMGGMVLAYGEQIELEFLDLDRDPSVDHPLADVFSGLENSLPLLFVNHQLKFKEGIPLMALKSVLDELGLEPGESPRAK